MRTFLLLDALGVDGLRAAAASRSWRTPATWRRRSATCWRSKAIRRGCMLFDEQTRQYLPPRTRGGHIRDLLLALEAAYAGGPHRAGRARSPHVGELADRRSLIVLFTRPARRARRPGRSPAPAALARARRRAVPPAGSRRGRAARSTTSPTSRAIEPDDARRLLVDPRDLAASFARESAALRERWRLTCLEARVEYRFATTADAARRGAARVPVRAPAGAALTVPTMHFLAPVAAARPARGRRCRGSSTASASGARGRSRFAAMELLLRAEREVSARRRLRDVAAAARCARRWRRRCRWRSRARSPRCAPICRRSTARSQSAVIVLDDSASMRAPRERGGDPLFERRPRAGARHRRAPVARFGRRAGAGVRRDRPRPIAELSSDRARVLGGAGRRRPARRAAPTSRAALAPRDADPHRRRPRADRADLRRSPICRRPAGRT